MTIEDDPFSQDVYGSGYTYSGTAPNVVITDVQGRTFRGTVDEAFSKYLKSTRDDSPFVAQEAAELRDLWKTGDGFSDRAMTQCASLETSVELI